MDPRKWWGEDLPERGVQLSLPPAPQGPETLSCLPTGRSSPCCRLFASGQCPWKAWRLTERESRRCPWIWSISRWSAWWKNRPQAGQRPPWCLIRVARRGRPVGDGPRRGLQLNLSRLHHWRPRGQTDSAVLQGTTACHHASANPVLPQPDPVFDDTTALDAAGDRRDPSSTVRQ